MCCAGLSPAAVPSAAVLVKVGPQICVEHAFWAFPRRLITHPRHHNAKSYRRFKLTVELVAPGGAPGSMVGLKQCMLLVTPIAVSRAVLLFTTSSAERDGKVV